MDEQWIVDAHGVEILTRWWPLEAPRAVVLLSHGASEHSGRYERFARALNDAGYAAAALDHRGHGRTATPPGVAGPGGGQALVDDLHLLRAGAASRHGERTPVFLFGHSMGAMVALAYLVQRGEGLAGGVLCGMPLDVGQAEGTAALLTAVADEQGRDASAAELLGEANAAFEPARTPFDWLSRDEAEVDRYLADPHCGDDHPLTYGYYLDLFEVVAPAAAALSSISCPVRVIAGDRDPVAGQGDHATSLAEALRTAGVASELQLYEGARHELLNETNRDDVTADVIRWLDVALADPAPTRSGPSGGRG